jgi:hypothetical protein
VLEAPGSGLREVDDRDLLDMTGDLVDVVVTNAALDGLTLAELGREQAVRGVFLRRHRVPARPWASAEHEAAPRRRAYRRGTVKSVERAADFIGVADRATDARTCWSSRRASLPAP